MHCSGLAWYTINGTEAKLLLGSRNLSISVRKVELVDACVFSTRNLVSIIDLCIYLSIRLSLGTSILLEPCKVRYVVDGP